MFEKLIIVTNNPMIKEKLQGDYTVDFLDDSVFSVLIRVRDFVHNNHKLLTHPLVSSIKPNEIPYRTIIISNNRDNNIDMESLDLIENSIATTNKFIKDFGIPNWNKSILSDFQLIDFDIIYNAIK